MSRRSASGSNPNKHCKTAGLQSFEFNAGIAESFFDSQPRQLSRPCRAVFDPIDRTLRHSGSFTKIGLAPTQHGPAGAELGGEQLPLVLNMTRRQIYFCVLVHEPTSFISMSPTKNPRREVPPGIVEFIPRSSDQGRKSR
jgi:hypothetical protein